MLRSVFRGLLHPGFRLAVSALATTVTAGGGRPAPAAAPAPAAPAVPAASSPAATGPAAAPADDAGGLPALRRRVRGAVLLPGDLDYDDERQGHNRDVDHRPSLLVVASGAADVMAAVAHATERELPVAVLSTGHTATPPADGAVLVNTRRMQGVWIDPVARRARVEAGVRWAKVAHEAAAFGLAPLSGSSLGVGVVGYTLGGGLPVLGRAFGYAADHVRSIDVVTAHGTLRHATPESFDDLFWALRGGKGNFGVVTSLEIDLVPAPVVYGGTLVFPGRAAPEVTQGYRRWTKSLPSEMSSSLAYLRMPLEAEGPRELRGRFVVAIRVAHLGPEAEGAELVRPLRKLGTPLLDTLRELPCTESGSIHSDPEEPFAVYERTACLKEFDEDAADALVDAAGPDTTCLLQLVEVRQLGGALGRDPEVPNCVGNRDAAYSLYTAAGTGPGVPAHANLVIDRLRPWHSGGKLLNFMGRNQALSDRDGAAYSPADLDRLGEIKRLYDPQNLFRINHNIAPAGHRRTWT
jgi:FAD/FMN-containing dehydrogenase